jgi:nitrate reductase NapAB chaperone NapD
MPIKSYLAHTHPNRASEAVRQLSALPGCTVAPAANRDILVLVTDTASEDAEAALRQQIDNAEAISTLTLVSAFATEDDLISIGATAKQ